jgi:anti-sigma B factor antagonist
MQIDITNPAPDVVQVALSGRLDLEGTQAIGDRFTFATTTRRAGVVIDLAGVTALSSIGIRLLLTAAKAQANRGGKLVLAGPQPFVRKVLEAAGIDQVVPIVTDVDAARASLGG